MKNTNTNLIAALTFGVLVMSAGGSYAQPLPVADNDDIEIVSVKDAVTSTDNIFIAAY